ncbi:MAG TPA: hypothetical protein VF453_09540 [Burkholderiaceae bacterium]
MAFYKYGNFLAQHQGGEFDVVWNPGTVPAVSGIYRCPGCGKEITHIGGTRLPPQNHHQHTYTQGSVRWQLLVAHQG